MLMFDYVHKRDFKSDLVGRVSINPLHIIHIRAHPTDKETCWIETPTNSWEIEGTLDELHSRCKKALDNMGRS